MPNGRTWKANRMKDNFANIMYTKDSKKIKEQIIKDSSWAGKLISMIDYHYFYKEKRALMAVSIILPPSTFIDNIDSILELTLDEFFKEYFANSGFSMNDKNHNDDWADILVEKRKNFIVSEAIKEEKDKQTKTENIKVANFNLKTSSITFHQYVFVKLNELGEAKLLKSMLSDSNNEVHDNLELFEEVYKLFKSKVNHLGTGYTKINVAQLGLVFGDYMYDIDQYVENEIILTEGKLLEIAGISHATYKDAVI